VRQLLRPVSVLWGLGSGGAVSGGDSGSEEPAMVAALMVVTGCRRLRLEVHHRCVMRGV
jgi:ABC-type hemin transport system substrate-binding protein